MAAIVGPKQDSMRCRSTRPPYLSRCRRGADRPLATNRSSSTNGSRFRFAACAQGRHHCGQSSREAYRLRPVASLCASIDRFLSRENCVSLGSSDRAFYRSEKGWTCPPSRHCSHCPWLTRTLLQASPIFARLACKHASTRMGSSLADLQYFWTAGAQAARSSGVPCCCD